MASLGELVLRELAAMKRCERTSVPLLAEALRAGRYVVIDPGGEPFDRAVAAAEALEVAVATIPSDDSETVEDIAELLLDHLRQLSVPVVRLLSSDIAADARRQLEHLATIFQSTDE